MIENLIPLLVGGGGGLVGGNIIGSLFRGKGVGAGSSTLVGVAAGALATHFFGPTYGPMIAGLIGGGDLGSLLGSGVTGLAGGAGGTLLWGLVKSVMGR